MSNAALHNRAHKISVIIPTYKDDAALEILLKQLQRLDVFEIIVVDGEGRWTPPHRMANFEKLQWKTTARGRGPQIAHGLACADGDYFWVLHADSQTDPNSLDEITRILNNPNISLGMFRLNFSRPQWTYHLFEFFARLDTGLTSFGDQGFFFRRDDVDHLWKVLYPALTEALILEDVTLRRHLKTLGAVKKSRLKIGSLPRRFERRGLWRTQIRNASILLQAAFGVPPNVLYNSYYGMPKGRPPQSVRKAARP